jgi:4-diphosphocytidyl-2-C-methyl-D-erythritol kinase
MTTDRALAGELGLVAEFAPAKVNLCLHVTGRRTDGYHLLDSLVVFAGVGDRITLLPGKGLALRLSGPESGALIAEHDNLVLRAAQAMGVKGAEVRLWKGLPVASGIGGGSADAAATLRAVARLTGQPLPDPAAVLALGADVPVCLAGGPVRMQGVGEVLTPLPDLPPLWMVLVNPRLPVATPEVFSALTSRDNPPLPGMPAAALRSAKAFAGWLARETRNDLAAAAGRIAPVLAEVEAALAATPGCLLARMSGSGATHFGLFAGPGPARDAAGRLSESHRGWWIANAPVLPSPFPPVQDLSPLE